MSEAAGNPLSDLTSLEEIGPWTEVKHEIIQKYASVYSRILTKNNFYHVYVDAFAGAGRYRSRRTGGEVPGSPEIALGIDPPFNEFHFIDLDSQKLTRLEQQAAGRHNVSIRAGDGNAIIQQQIAPLLRYEDYRRGLCLLDPYGLHLKWETVRVLAALRSTEVFINFPTMDINRNVLRVDPDRTDPAQARRMTAFWGDDSWRDSFYGPRPQLSLFTPQGEEKFASNYQVASAYRDRLLKTAGFTYVPEPLPMRNSSNAIVYFLFFASYNATGHDIVSDIFAKYRQL